MKQLFVLVGNIGTGKSTIAKTFINKETIAISRDNLRHMIGSGDYIFNTKLEPSIKLIEEYAITELMKSEFNIVIDETNINMKARHRLIVLADGYKYKKTAIVLPALSKDKSLKRRMQIDRGYTKEEWEEVWEKFRKEFQSPSYTEGFDNIIYLNEKELNENFTNKT